MFFTNINKWDPQLAYRLDNGIISRIAMLSTKYNIELEDEKRYTDAPSLLPFIYLPWLAEQHGVSLNALMLYFARLCADKFLRLIESEDKRALECEMKYLTSKLRCQFNEDTTNSIINCLHLSKYLLSKQFEPADWALPEINTECLLQCLRLFETFALSPAFHLARTLLKDDWEAKNRPDGHAWKAISRLKSHSISASVIALAQSADLLKYQPNEAIRLAFKPLTLKDGFTVGSGPVWVVSAWEEARINADGLKALAKHIYGKLAEAGLAKEVREDIPANRDMLARADFDAHRIAVQGGQSS